MRPGTRELRTKEIVSLVSLTKKLMLTIFKKLAISNFFEERIEIDDKIRIYEPEVFRDDIPQFLRKF